MANEPTETRALSAALSGPAFAPRSGGNALHAANRHLERWAPEATASQQRPLRSLGFVDRMIAPWLETAQRSAGLRMFSQFRETGVAEHQGRDVSWVFPRPWYRDELDWMAAAREQAMQQAQRPMLTTRGTYTTPAQQAMAMPTALYEYIAPALSIAAPEEPVAHHEHVVSAPTQRREAFSTLVPLAAVHAAEVMARTVQRLPAASVQQSPALRSVLATMLARTATQAEPTRISQVAPELVTPPAPRENVAATVRGDEPEQPAALQVAERFAAQRAQVVELQRIARQSAEREYTARVEAARAAQPAQPAIEAAEPVREPATVEQARIEDRVAQRVAERAAARASEQRVVEEAAREQQARVEERVREERVRALEDRARAEVQARVEPREDVRIEERRAGARRLHEQARAEAAAHARASTTASAPAITSEPPPSSDTPRIPDELSAALAALPPELARHLVRRPERAVQAIDELTEAFRTMELMARSTASGTTFEPTRGPRLMMPAGLGGLVAAVDRAQTIDRPVDRPVDRPLPQAMLASPAQVRVPMLPWVVPAPLLAPTSALAASVASQPAALGHVAWSDRWLARFSGASQRSLDALAIQHGPRVLETLASAAPGAVFVSPAFFDIERDAAPVNFDAVGRPVPMRSAVQPALSIVPPLAPVAAETPVVRFDDNAETPDDVFAAISQAASRGRGPARAAEPVVAPPAPLAIVPAERPTLADAISHDAPVAAGAGLAAQLASSPFAPALRHVLPLPLAQRFDVRALLGGALSASYLAGLFGDSTTEVEVASANALPMWSRWLAPDETAGTAERFAPSWDPTYVTPEPPARTLAHTDDDDVADAPRMSQLAPLVTLKSALLAWDVETTFDASRADARIERPAGVAAGAASATPSVSRALVEAMSLPMLGDVAGDPSEPMWAAPGMIANRAHTFSVAQERSASDLAFDFVTPELVLAARVYGLGPAEAAQAMRLAIAGPGQLSAMANTVDRTFLQAMAIESDRRERPRLEAGYPAAAPSTRAAPFADRAPSEAELRAEVATSPGAAFGVERRTPRGAFLWPSASVAALQLNAPGPDGAHAMPVAALELLAAQAVAELGTFAALSVERVTDEDGTIADDEPALARRERSVSAQVFTSAADVRGAIEQAQPSESDVIGAAGSLIPASRRARFESLYVALGTSAASGGWSPAARAARALALAGRGEDAPVSARERAATVWDVLPVVYASELGSDDGATPATGARGGTSARSRRGGRDLDIIHVDGRPGLGLLSARAGEALGSYVAPAHAPSAPRESRERDRESGAVLRAPTAAQEMVQTGRASGRYGGGEVEIPSWFESAARKMFDSQQSSVSDGISISELTLIQNAPSHQIAASTRSAASPVAPSIGGGVDAKAGQQVDIEKLANEIYRQILTMMDAARARNGEPYL